MSEEGPLATRREKKHDLLDRQRKNSKRARPDLDTS